MLKNLEWGFPFAFGYRQRETDPYLLKNINFQLKKKKSESNKKVNRKSEAIFSIWFKLHFPNCIFR